MNFITIHQYFNKLQILFFVLMIIPLLVFIALYFFANADPSDIQMAYTFVIPIVAIFDWLLAIIIFNKKIKSARNAQGLGAKLDKYFDITIVRYCFLMSASLILALGFYLSRNDLFGGLYVVGLILSAFLWPTGPRVARDLMLRGDEREMVYFKKDNF